MLIGGLLKFTLIDFPGKIAAAVFTRGCNFRCPYCHNPQLVLPRRYQLPLNNDEILDFLYKRYGKLDGVVVSGGEPLLQEGLQGFLHKLKKTGYKIKLDTNGTRAGKLKALIKNELVDYIALDIKAPFTKYVDTVHVPVNIEQIQKSINIIRQSKVDYEFRTTIVKNLHQINEIKNIVDILRENEKYYLQNYVEAPHVGSSKIKMMPFSKEEILGLQEHFTSKGINCQLR